jgi:hypothetical protein
LVYFVAIRFILWLFGKVFPNLVCCTKKNQATLIPGGTQLDGGREVRKPIDGFQIQPPFRDSRLVFSPQAQGQAV